MELVAWNSPFSYLVLNGLNNTIIYGLFMVITIISIITLSTQHTSLKRTFTTSADPDELARNEPSHQDTHCL